METSTHTDAFGQLEVNVHLESKRHVLKMGVSVCIQVSMSVHVRVYLPLCVCVCVRACGEACRSFSWLLISKRHVFTFWYNNIKLEKKEKKQLKKQKEKEKGKSTRLIGEKSLLYYNTHTFEHCCSRVGSMEGSSCWCSISVTRIQSWCSITIV